MSFSAQGLTPQSSPDVHLMILALCQTLIRGIEAFNRVISAMVNSLLYISPLGIGMAVARCCPMLCS